MRISPKTAYTIQVSGYQCIVRRNHICRPADLNSSGHKEVDDEARRSDCDTEFWADHDEDSLGIREDLADEPDYSRGFIWSCCNQRGDADGCREREHDVWIKRASASKEERYSFADLVGFA